MNRGLVAGVVLLGGLAIGVGIRQSTLRVGPVGTQHGSARFVHPDSSISDGEGEFVVLPSRPVDLAVSPNGALVAVKENKGVTMLTSDLKIVGSWESKDGSSPIGIAWKGDGTVFVTTGGKFLAELSVSSTGEIKELRRIDLGGGFPGGFAISADRATAYVALSTRNEIAKVNLTTGTVSGTIKTAIAPFAVVLDPTTGHLLVSEQGGETAVAGQLSATSANANVQVDRRGIAVHGSLSEYNPANNALIRRVKTPTLPSSVVVWGEGSAKSASVACANGDAIVHINLATGKATTTNLRQKGGLGMLPTGLAYQDGRLVTTLAGENKLLELADGGKRLNEIRTDWYPVTVSAHGDNLFVACVKGQGSRTRPNDRVGYSSHGYSGTIRKVNRSNFKPFRPTRLASTAKGFTPPIKHIVYVIKENRTYDQVFGAMGKGDGEPSLCMYGEQVTPNHHAIARRWVLLDNYYCSGVLSADGHSWATEGMSTPYLERSFGGFNRSYTFGDDPLTYSSAGFIWDAVQKAGLSHKNFGEFDYAEPAGALKGKALYLESLKPGAKLQLTSKIGVANVKKNSDPEYPGWNMDISDQYRVSQFLDDLEGYKKSGKFPNLVTMYLPQDHCGGPVSPKAHVADNDLAVGRLLEALSRSPFWKNMLVIINEDDPQDGLDHIDGHRSLCLVAGPYVRRGAVSSELFTQSSALHTITRLFGLPPLNRKVAITRPFDSLFTDRPDFSPYSHVPANIPLDDAAPTTGLYPQALAKLDLSRQEVQTEAEMDLWNRALWDAARPGERYPEEWAGAHGRGLASKGLLANKEGEEDED